MGLIKAIFNGWIRPRMEYQAAQIVSAAETAAGRGSDGPAQEDDTQEVRPPEGGDA